MNKTIATFTIIRTILSQLFSLGDRISQTTINIVHKIAAILYQYQFLILRIFTLSFLVLFYIISIGKLSFCCFGLFLSFVVAKRPFYRPSLCSSMPTSLIRRRGLAITRQRICLSSLVMQLLGQTWLGT